MRKFWMITQGSRIGWRDIPRGWTVHLIGAACVYQDTLKDAKEWAVDYTGASGKWRRERKPRGVRQAMVTVYYDATPPTPPTPEDAG